MPVRIPVLYVRVSFRKEKVDCLFVKGNRLGFPIYFLFGKKSSCIVDIANNAKLHNLGDV